MRCKGPLAVKKPDFFTDKSEKVRLSSFADQTLSRAVALSLAANVPPSDIPTLRPWWDHWYGMVWHGGTIGWHLSRKRLMMESLVTVR